MPADPDTCAAFLTDDRMSAELRRRRRRERIGHAAILACTALVLVALLAFPLFLVARIVSWAPLPEGAWIRLGALLAGTIKATACALAVALPIGIAAALFSAHFAAPGFRAWFKPCLELLEAMPTVVLGLIAVATLAPWLKTNVATLLAILVVVPAALLAAAMAFGGRMRRRTGWLPLWLLPVLLALVALVVILVGPHQHGWIVPASPWNAVVVGLALGLAATPLVFSLTDEAMASVPPAHVHAALALGATRWHAVRSVVLPAARPGLVAAMALGASRCAGETMIVLMASGNTPLTSADPLEGLRAMSSELALALPEASPASGTYRVLLLAALALFVLTFALNFFAARARSRLRAGAATSASALR
ncbi:MAG TPA: ABC transporter permease subunit [Rhodanobacteraceae bacterium]|nr:ABC transporter permease subunit [Rhodanobacteraceae bacterium]